MKKKHTLTPPKKGRNSTTPKKEETANSPPKKRRNTTTPKKGKNHQQTPKNLGRKTLNFLDAKIIGAPQQPGPPDGLRLLPRSQAYRHPSPSRDERCLWATKRRNDVGRSLPETNNSLPLKNRCLEDYLRCWEGSTTPIKNP